MSVNGLEPNVEINNPEDMGAKRRNWAGFVETTVVNFFTEHDLEKLTIEDGNGNKAKLTVQKNNGIKVEYTSTTLL